MNHNQVQVKDFLDSRGFRVEFHIDNHIGSEGPIVIPPTCMRLRFWGVRGSTPTPLVENLGYGGNTTCLAIELPSDELIIIDAGTGVRLLGLSLMEQLRTRPLSLHFLVTHFHWDHIQGLPFFLPLYSADQLVVFHSNLTELNAREVLEGQMASPYFPVGFEHLAAKRQFVHASESTFNDSALSVHPFPLNHPQGAVGYRIERDGAVIVHASDLEHGNPKTDKILREYSEGADVLIYDAQFTPAEYEFRKGWGHSTWLEATKVARDSNVKRLVLFHHDPSHNDDRLTSICEDARKEFENTDIATEGSSIDV